MTYIVVSAFVITLGIQIFHNYYFTKKIKKTMDELASAVAANTTVIESALVLINGFADRLAAAIGDPTKLKALSDELNSEKDKLAAAVAANTPAA